MQTKTLLLILVIGAGAAACSGTEAETPSAAVETTRSVPVRTATVQTRDLAETLSLTGTLDPRSEVTVVPGDFRAPRARAQDRGRSGQPR